jgi:hypothetical protein
MTAILERNRQMLQMRNEGVRRVDVARGFGLSTERISQLEKRDQTDKSMAERRVELRKEIRAADDPGKLWFVDDLADAIGLVGGTKRKLLGHFVKIGKDQISLRELMDMCLDNPVDFMVPPLLMVRGIGSRGFWSVANGLTDMDLGGRCDDEWRNGLVKVKQSWSITGPTPYSSLSA